MNFVIYTAFCLFLATPWFNRLLSKPPNRHREEAPADVAKALRNDENVLKPFQVIYFENIDNLRQTRQEYEKRLKKELEHGSEKPEEQNPLLRTIASTYSWAIPNERSLKIIARYSPLGDKTKIDSGLMLSRVL